MDFKEVVLTRAQFENNEQRERGLRERQRELELEIRELKQEDFKYVELENKITNLLTERHELIMQIRRHNEKGRFGRLKRIELPNGF